MAQHNHSPAPIPAPLRDRHQWVCWRYEERAGKRTKVPYVAGTERRASSTDPSTWVPFDVAWQRRQRYDGSGIVLTDTDNLVGVDLDHCVDRAGTIADWAADIVACIDSYTEITPSGEGVRIFCTGTLPPGGRKRGNVEMYERERFLTVTGNRVDGTRDTVEERTEQLAAVHEEYFQSGVSDSERHRAAAAAAANNIGPVYLDEDYELLERARGAANGQRFADLWAGDISAYSSRSEADLALCSALAFWTAGDTARMDRLFRMSLLYRAKWDERRGAQTYGERTLARAAASTRNGYGDHRNFTSGPKDPPSEVKLVDTTSRWPGELAPQAYHGLAGRIVAALESRTESDPVAILTQTLVAFGSAIGRGPHFRIEATRHAANEYIVLVGHTSKARKGTSWDHARSLYRDVDEDWSREHVTGGLSSGEGLIAEVRDPVVKAEVVRDKGRPTGDYEQVTQDPGVADKRLLLVEAEFSRVLRVMNRETNTLSQILRDAWDGRDLRTMVRQSPLRSTEPHISIVGHITRDEARRELSSTDAANGFGNRFIWLAVRRSRELPFGGDLLGTVERAPLIHSLREAIAFGKSMGEVGMTPSARALWIAEYSALSRPKPGLLGALIGRGEAHTRRLAMLYALLDGSNAVDVDHLQAALALWAYAEASAHWVFGDMLGDPIADTVLEALRQRGPLTRTEISDLFSRHRDLARLGAALSALAGAGLARPEKFATGGRPVERWRAC